MIFANKILSIFNNAHSDNYVISKGMAWIILFVFFGKLAGAAKEMAIAYRYGISSEVDAYLFVFNLVNWPVGIWFSGLTVVLVPLLPHVRQSSLKDMPRFRSELLGLTLLFGMGLMLLTWLGLPVLLQTQWTGLTQETIYIATTMVTGVGLLALFGGLISLFSAWMLSTGGHANTLMESIPAIVLLAAVIIFPRGAGGVLVWGTVVGYVFHLASLAVPLVRQGEIAAPNFTYQSTQWSPFWQGFGITIAGQSLMSCIGVIDQFYAAHLGTGAIAKLNYANRILALMLGLGATAITRAMLPVFSQVCAQVHVDRSVHLRLISNNWLWIMFVFGAITMFVGWWMAPWMVRILFERGAFTASDTLAVTEILRYGLIQLPFYFSGLVLVSLLASQRKYTLISISAGVNLIVKVISNFFLIPLMGIGGIVAATGIMYLTSLALLYWFVNGNNKNWLKHK